MRITKLLVMLLAFSFSFFNFVPPSWAGNEGPNGGDGIALEIKLIGETLVAKLNENPGLIAKDKVKELNDLIVNPQFVIHTVDQPLYIDGERKDAINETIDGIPEMRVNVKYWTDFHPIVRSVLVAHELFCLVGLEKTDFYQISTHVVLELYRDQYLSQGWSDEEMRQAENLIIQFQYDLGKSDGTQKDEADLIKQIKRLDFKAAGNKWPIF